MSTRWFDKSEAKIFIESLDARAVEREKRDIRGFYLADEANKVLPQLRRERDELASQAKKAHALANQTTREAEQMRARIAKHEVELHPHQGEFVGRDPFLLANGPAPDSDRRRRELADEVYALEHTDERVRGEVAQAAGLDARVDIVQYAIERLERYVQAKPSNLPGWLRRWLKGEKPESFEIEISETVKNG